MGKESRDKYGVECSVYGMCELFDQNKKMVEVFLLVTSFFHSVIWLVGFTVLTEESDIQTF
jgi:hypothetical protein